MPSDKKTTASKKILPTCNSHKYQKNDRLHAVFRYSAKGLFSMFCKFCEMVLFFRFFAVPAYKRPFPQTIQTISPLLQIRISCSACSQNASIWTARKNARNPLFTLGFRAYLPFLQSNNDHQPAYGTINATMPADASARMPLLSANTK